MRVICIKDDQQYGDAFPSVIKGNVYTVIDSEYHPELYDDLYTYPAGTYYTLAECGEWWYYEDLFIKINEDQLDETEFERTPSKQTI